MAITATSSGSTQREPIPSGNYLARCIRMIHVGTVEEIIMGEKKILNKVRITWEMPTELRVFKEENGQQPLVIDKEFTLSLHEKSALRGVLKSWRGKDFTDKEAEAFDITKLIGIPCMLNIIHKNGVKDPTKVYEQISGVTPLPKGVKCPDQINPSFVLSYDEWSEEKFNSLPDFIKGKMMTSVEYKALKNPAHNEVKEEFKVVGDDESDLPFSVLILIGTGLMGFMGIL